MADNKRFNDKKPTDAGVSVPEVTTDRQVLSEFVSLLNSGIPRRTAMAIAKGLKSDVKGTDKK